LQTAVGKYPKQLCTSLSAQNGTSSHQMCRGHLSLGLEHTQRALGCGALPTGCAPSCLECSSPMGTQGLDRMTAGRALPPSGPCPPPGPLGHPSAGGGACALHSSGAQSASAQAQLHQTSAQNTSQSPATPNALEEQLRAPFAAAPSAAHCQGCH